MLNFLRICKEFFKVTVPFYTPPGNEPWMLLRRTDAEADTLICGCLMWRASPLGKTLMLGKTGGRRRNRPQRLRWLDGITDSMGMSEQTREWRTGKPGVLQFTGSQRVGRTEQLNWTELKRVPEKNLLLLYWQCQSLWLCGSQ